MYAALRRDVDTSGSLPVMALAGIVRIVGKLAQR